LAMKRLHRASLFVAITQLIDEMTFAWRLSFALALCRTRVRYRTKRRLDDARYVTQILICL